MRRTLKIRDLRRWYKKTKMEEYPTDIERPTKRSHCVNGPRPCPWVSCRHHLYLDVTVNGGVRVNHPDVDVWDMKETCSLDVTEMGPQTLDEVGTMLNLTRERVRQIQVRACRDIRNDFEKWRGLSEILDRIMVSDFKRGGGYCG